MKKFYLLPLFALLASLATTAQSSFSDDFESYNANAKLATTSPVWETWSGNVASEDAPVVTAQAHSGTKSLLLQTTVAAGGPSDIICKFGGAHDSGNFTLEFWMFVVTGKGGYFNLQAENTPGQKWAADFYFDKSGKFNINGNGNTAPLLVDADFPVGKWFKFHLDVDLTSNKWEVLIDDATVGTFANPLNKIASIDIFAYGPTGSIGQFYVDDFSYSFEPLVLPQTDAAMFSLDSRKFGLVGQTIPVRGTIRNTGLDAITSFDVSVNGGAKQTFSGLNIASLATYSFKMTAPYTLKAGDQNITMTISNINGSATADAVASNNTIDAASHGYTPAPGRAVVVEEATGTWCQWCPRGAVFVDSLSRTYGDYFIGIAVHNNDPMTVTDYNAGLTSFPDFTGFPSVVVNRTTLLDPSEMELPFLQGVEITPDALIKNGANYDASTSDIQISITATPTHDLSGDYRLNVILVEDGLHGTDATWAQSNAYAGGGAGIMGGFEALPSPVPAAQMVYNHVGRVLGAGFFGNAGELPNDLSAGGKYTANYSLNLGDNDIVDPAKMHIVGLLLGPNGEIVNASRTTIAEAVAHGFVLGTHDALVENSLQLAPNPASDRTFLHFTLKNSAETVLSVFNAMGQKVSEQAFGNLSGEQVLPISVGQLAAGAYMVQVVADGQVFSQKLVVKK